MDSSQLSNIDNTQLTQQISELAKNDLLAESRLQYLTEKQHTENFDDILRQKETEDFYSIYLDLTNLKSKQPELYKKLFCEPLNEFAKWNAAAKSAMIIHLRARQYLLGSEASVKNFVTVRFINNPVTEKSFPKYRKCGKLFQLKGVVHSISAKHYVEYDKEFVCTNKKCKHIMVSHGCYNKYFAFETPKACSKCDASLKLRTDIPFKKYAHLIQEIMLEEESYNFVTKSILKVTVEDDLTDKAELGDSIFVVGTLESRQKSIFENMEMDIEFVLRANSIKQLENKVDSLSEEIRFMVDGDWFNLVDGRGEFGARDQLIASFDPDIYGMNLPKFLILLSLASSVHNEKHRAQSHILLVGTTGIAKSHLLLRAAELSPKGYFGGCYRVSAAGLTVGISTVDGKKIYEMGILPKSDGGVCCLDEFNQLSDTDKGAIHEAMEQQTIHITKGGLIAKLNSRCVIIAACNPRDLQAFMENDGKTIDFNIQPALLSRFDAIFVLRDFDTPRFHKNISKQVATRCFTSQSDLYSTEMLKRHLLATRDINPKISVGADKILQGYYAHIYKNTQTDPCRKTIRCLQALYRLSKAYARLLLREEVIELDAVVIIRLIMENSYSMEGNSDQHNLIEKPLPLGPTESECKNLLNTFGLADFIPKVLKQLVAANRPSHNGGNRSKAHFDQENHSKSSKESPSDFTRQSDNPKANTSFAASASQFMKNVNKESIQSTQVENVLDPLQKLMDELENDRKILTQKLQSETPVQSVEAESGMDFLDELELIVQGGTSKNTESELNEKSKSEKRKTTSTTETAKEKTGTNFKDALKQFSFSQQPKKLKVTHNADTLDIKESRSTTKQPKNTTAKPSADNFADDEFDNILRDIRNNFGQSVSSTVADNNSIDVNKTNSDILEQPNDSNVSNTQQQSEVNKALDIQALLREIDESYFGNDF